MTDTINFHVIILNDFFQFPQKFISLKNNPWVDFRRKVLLQKSGRAAVLAQGYFLGILPVGSIDAKEVPSSLNGILQKSASGYIIEN